MSSQLADHKNGLKPDKEEKHEEQRNTPHPLMWILAAIIFIGGVYMFYVMGWT